MADPNHKLTVLVTGASRGIGKAIAESLLNDGFYVIGTTRKSVFPDHILNHENFKALTVDLASDIDVETQLLTLLRSENAPDILVNNAAVCEACSLDLEESACDQNFTETMKINLDVPCLLSRVILKKWLERKSGTLINITSRAAYRGDTADYAAYAASKAGLTAYAKSIFRDYGKFGISVFNIAPGFVNTEMAKPFMEKYGKDYVTKDIPLGEVVPPEEIGDLVTFLVSGKAKHLSGSTLQMNGGSYMV